MKKKKWMIAIGLILAVGIAVVVYVLCNITVVTVTDQYRITREFGQCYLAFHDRSYFKGNPKPDSLCGLTEDYGLGFDSVEEFVDDFMRGNFTEKEIANLKKHEHDNFGRIRIPDITKLCTPRYPEDFRTDYRIRIQDNALTFQLQSERTSYYCGLTITTRDAYLKRKDMMINLEKYTDQTMNSVVSKEKIEDRNATVYHGENGKILVYAIETSNCTMYIEEHCSADGGILYHYLQIVGESSGLYFDAYIQGFPQRPSVEWLSEFELVKYNRRG